MLVLNILKMCFKTYLNHPINQKTSRKKKPKGDHSFQKKGGGGVRRGMIMITDSMVIFYGFTKRFGDQPLTPKKCYSL